MRNLVVAASIAALSIAAPGRSLALQYVEGQIGPGTIYGIWVPERWNGDLVLYAHGFRNPNCPPVVPTNPGGLPPTQLCPDADSGTPATVTPVRDTLLSLGYAFAASSYSAVGFALKEGADQTFQLKKIFSSRFRPPQRTYLYGHSMGGAIVLKLAEQHPEAFDAALAMCGMIGGTPPEAQYALDARATFDAIFPGVVPGGVASVPPNLTFYFDVMPAVLALFDPANPNALENFGRAMAWASLDQVAFPFETAEELVHGILEFLFVQTLGTPGVVKAAHGYPADNTAVVYTGPSGTAVDLGAVNAAAERIAATPQSLAWAVQWYDTTGAISFPVLTVHTIRDAAVPLVHERNYAAKVAAAGRSGLLVQRTVSHDPATQIDGHCSFKVAEELAAFSDLLQWVHTGARPAGGDATAP
jgi:alpha-beta hydrolase superfamily lysophospholipase